eukprot:367418-Rhodomonas_salina.1
MAEGAVRGAGGGVDQRGPVGAAVEAMPAVGSLSPDANGCGRIGAAAAIGGKHTLSFGTHSTHRTG